MSVYSFIKEIRVYDCTNVSATDLFNSIRDTWSELPIGSVLYFTNLIKETKDAVYSYLDLIPSHYEYVSSLSVEIAVRKVR